MSVALIPRPAALNAQAVAEIADLIAILKKLNK